MNLLANAELDKVLVFGNKVGSNGNGGGYAGLGLGNAASIVKIEGNVNITGNKKNNDENNIALLNRQVILLTKKLTGSFGVTAWLEPYSSSNQDVNKPYISTVQGADGYEVSPQDFAHINSDNTLYSVLMIEGNIVNAANGEKGKVLVLGNESTGNLSDIALSIKDGSSGEEIKLSPDFAETTYEYTVTVPNSVKAVSIEATPKNAGADVAMTIQNADNATDTTVAADNIPLAEGENTIKVKVTEGDASKVYIIIITREEAKGNPVTITSYKDGVEWTEAPSGYRLTSDDGKTFLPGLAAPDGTYKIYIGDIDTGVEVTVAGAEVTARVDYYTVTFYDGNTELTAPAQQIVLKGAAASVPADNPSKMGYTFDKWVTTSGGSTEYDFTKAVTGKTLLYAKWTPNTYQVTFVYHGADGGNTTTSKNVTYDSKFGDLPVPTRTGYTFKGWYTEADGQGSEVDADTVVTKTSDHTLHAWWKDETPPDKPVLQDGVTLPADWTNAQNKIPLKLYDGVGVTGLQVSVDGSPYAEVKDFSGGTGSVLYDYFPTVLEGEHTYRFKAVDAAGNFSESERFTIKLDLTSPVIGTLTYDNAVHLNLWHWIIGKKAW